MLILAIWLGFRGLKAVVVIQRLGLGFPKKKRREETEYANPSQQLRIRSKQGN